MPIFYNITFIWANKTTILRHFKKYIGKTRRCSVHSLSDTMSRPMNFHLVRHFKFLFSSWSEHRVLLINQSTIWSHVADTIASQENYCRALMLSFLTKYIIIYTCIISHYGIIIKIVMYCNCYPILSINYYYFCFSRYTRYFLAILFGSYSQIIPYVLFLIIYSIILFKIIQMFFKLIKTE